jgi:Glycosyl hydrolase family 79 C-terminal beta domain
MVRSLILKTYKTGVNRRSSNALRALALVLAVGAITAAPAACSATTATATTTTPATSALPVTVSSRPLGPGVASGFVGLATEYWDVEQEVGRDPAEPDVAFEHVAENLAPDGAFSLRIGGDSTDWTWFPIPGMTQPPWVRWTMTPTWAAVTKRLVDDLKAHLIIGVNMEADNLKVDDAEINEIKTGIGGSNPITFELGNEPELYSHFPFYHTAAGEAVLGRPKTYSLLDMASQWNDIAKALPSVRLAGPGYSSLTALPYVGQFLSSTKRLSLLTVHTYPLKSKRCNAGETLQESDLFDADSLQNLASGVNSWSAVAHKDGVGLRVDEINSVTCGGQPGFTGSFGPALWALNILPLYAEDGISGVNFQTRPYTAQNLIQTDDKAAGWRVYVEPEYYGLLAFAQLTPPGSRILSVSKLKDGLLDWAVRTPKGQTHVVITNPGRSTVSVAVRAAGASGNATIETLRSSSGGLSAQSGITLGGQSVSTSTGELSGHPVTNSVRLKSGAYAITVPAASAQILTF